MRKIHIIVFSPSLEICEKINAHLGWIGNLKSDGRPILGLDAKELVKIVMDISKDCFIVPAHIWTPWFSLFGSRSGFDSIEECFEDFTKHIYALETGLSSDPAMNWRLSALDRFVLISNGDSHSPKKIGREANVFNTDVSYPAMVEAMKDKDPKRFLYTIEFFPEEGKYHYDGHRLCEIRLSPKETKQYNNICPRCGKPLTIGVLNRVEELADRPEGYKPETTIPFKSLVPLYEVIAQALGQMPTSKQVDSQYHSLVKEFGNEFEVLLNTSYQDLEGVVLPEIAEAIIRVRDGKVDLDPGYDGVFGKIKLSSQAEKKNLSKQQTLI